jgi:phytoene dehydrogenase-like protein
MYRRRLAQLPSATVIGAGPNGLAAAIALTQAGVSVDVHEAQAEPGGGVRSGELTLPGFTHDLFSAIYPMAVSSPFFRSLALDVDWLHSPAPFAHPLDDGTAVLMERDIPQTADNLGDDGPAYAALLAPLADAWADLADGALRPLGFPRHPWLMAQLGIAALRAGYLFRGSRARALFAGLAAHSCLPLEDPVASAVGLMLAIPAHAVGWPFPRGGAGQLTRALVERLRALGGVIHTSSRVQSLSELSGTVLCDLTPRQLVEFAPAVGSAYRNYRYGPGVYKVDWALSRPVPWRAAECLLAATVHVGGTYEEIAASERDAWEGRISERPFVLVAQPSLFDASRAPQGKHTLWAYCHVPNGSAEPMLDRIEAQIERFAPGFRDCIVARHVMPPAALERANANLVGGDLNGGRLSLRQMVFRPTWRRYRTPVRGLYLCSSSTPPGGGVHGMCGYYAAQAALR